MLLFGNYLYSIIKYALQHTLPKVIPNSFVPSNDVIHKSFLFLKHVQHLLIYGHENANENKWNLFPSRSHYSTYGNMFINIRRSGENETKVVATLKSTANVIRNKKWRDIICKIIIAHILHIFQWPSNRFSSICVRNHISVNV